MTKNSKFRYRKKWAVSSNEFVATSKKKMKKLPIRKF